MTAERDISLITDTLPDAELLARLAEARAELLARLAEACAELGQAALQLRRVIVGENPAPVTTDKAQAALLDEMADTGLCLEIVRESIFGDEAIGAIAARQDAKAERWARRLEDGA